MDRRCFSETNFNNTPMRGLVHSQTTARRLIVTAAVTLGDGAPLLWTGNTSTRFHWHETRLKPCDLPMATAVIFSY